MSRFLDEIDDCVPALRRYARALTHNRDLADDLVQDCLERAIVKERLWRPSGMLRAWLFKILLNVYRNDRRREQRRPSPIPLDGLKIEPHTAAPQPDRLALTEIARALDLLPDEQREALLLVVLEGLSYAEAARSLSIPQGTLTSRLSRARATLRRLTEDSEQPRLRTIK